MKPAIVLGMLLLAVTAPAWATDRIFRDIVAASPNGRYRVEARSPDNAPGGQGGRAFRAFQASFVYSCTDTESGQTLWTRKQPMEDPTKPGAVVLGKEGSPVRIYVSDSGWTVICTGWDELISVDPNGVDGCHIGLLSAAMTEDERKNYVVRTTAGPMWQGHSLWYFLETDGRRLFVIRPWWGRHIIVDIAGGALLQEDPAVSAAVLAHEREFVLTKLKKGIETRKDWEENANHDREAAEAALDDLTAAYLAGKLGVREAVPLLRQLEGSPLNLASSTAWSEEKPAEGGVDRSSWDEMTMRRVVHLSLRRLGETPGPYPGTRFFVYHEKPGNLERYPTPEVKLPRAQSVGKVRKGMTPEQVLATIGAPDFNERDVWYYDMDTTDPFTLCVRWRKNALQGVVQVRPPLWQTDKWDRSIFH